MKFHIIPDEDALNNCTWCDRRIDEFTDVVAVGAAVRPEVELQAYQSHCIQIDLASCEKSLSAMVTAEDSEAKAAQHDLLFLTCSETCGAELHETLAQEVSLGKLFERV